MYYEVHVTKGDISVTKGDISVTKGDISVWMARGQVTDEGSSL